MSTRNLLSLALCIGVLCAPNRSAAQNGTAASRGWKPASFSGLVVGRSSCREVPHKMGKPDYEGPPADATSSTERALEYDVTQPVKGRLRFYCKGRKALLTGIIIESVELNKTDAIRMFGNDFIVTRYSTDYCLGEGGVSPIYEDPSGEIVQMEYRRRGLALELKGAEVSAIIYTDRPFGPKKSRCTGGQKKIRKGGRITHDPVPR